MLAFQSNVFAEEFFGSPPKNEVTVADFDRETFQIFLDCLIGLKPYTVIDSLLIFPIAHKFQVLESLKKCTEVLKPRELNDNVLLTLNLALFYECHELIDNIINFYQKNVSIAKLLEDENFNKLLEPAAMVKLTENVQMDSYLWKAVYEWGENYLIKCNKGTNVKRFFEENKICEKFCLSDFESAQSIFEFHESVTKKKFVSRNELLRYFKDCLVKDENELPKKSEWVFVKKGDTIEEKIIFKNPLSFAYSATTPSGLMLEIWRNDILSYDYPKYSNENDNKIVSYNFTYKYKDCQADSARYSKDPDQSQDYQSEENIISDKSKKITCSIEIRRPSYLLEISSIGCTYKFFSDCRILKTSPNKSLNVCDDKILYFTHNVICKKK